MGCEHNTGFFEKECALCKNNWLLEDQQIQNRDIARQNERIARENLEAIKSQIQNDEKMEREAANREQRLIQLEREKMESAERLERKKLESAERLQKNELAVASAKLEFESAERAWNKNPSFETAFDYGKAKNNYLIALGNGSGFSPAPYPKILAEYKVFNCKIFDEKGEVSVEELKNDWVQIEQLSYILSLRELFSPNDPIQRQIKLIHRKALSQFEAVVQSKENLALLLRCKEQRIEEERIAAEKWEAERPMREKAKRIGAFSLICTISMFLLPLLLPNASLIWSPVLFFLATNIAGTHISQFFLPNISDAKENWLAKIRIYQVNVAGLVVAIPATMTSIFLSLVIFFSAYGNNFVALIYSVIVGAIVFLHVGERNIVRLDKKQSLADFAQTLILEFGQYLKRAPSNLKKSLRL